MIKPTASIFFHIFYGKKKNIRKPYSAAYRGEDSHVLPVGRTHND